MRLKALLLAGLLAGCAQPSTLEVPAHLSLTNTESKIENTQISMDQGVTVTSLNVDFETPRRLERQTPAEVSTASLSNDEISDLAKAEIAKLFPDLQLKMESVEKAGNFFFVNLEQYYDGLKIFGAKASLRLTKNGEWKTIHSSLINNDLLRNFSRQESVSISSKDYLIEPHHVISEESVILPKKSDSGLQLYQARQIVALNERLQQENWLWINEQTGESLAAFNPSAGLKAQPLDESALMVSGSVFSNGPDDPLQDVLFPGVSLVMGNSKIESDQNGRADRAKISEDFEVKLENDFVVVANNKRPTTGFHFKANDARGAEIKMEGDGPTIEERNTFYWLMVARRYLEDKLNYHGMNYKLLAVVNYGERFDNAFFMPLTKTLSFGAGGQYLKNTAMSRDVIIHEFGHGVTHEIYGIVSNYEFNAMNEAFSDYFAATITNDPAIAEGGLQPSIGRPWLRNVDNNLVYPKDFLGNRFHDDGQMFSGALWNIRKSVGAEKADMMVHQARLSRAASIHEFYQELLALAEDQDDKDPFTNSKDFNVIRSAFAKKGLTSPDIRFAEKKENLTMPWKRSIGCLGIAGAE